MPEPRDDETRDEWMERCMSDEESREDFPDSDQRFAFCQSVWEESQNSLNMPDNQIEHKFFNFESKAVDLQDSVFTGFGAALGNRDLGNDIIHPGAFKKTARERVAAGNVKLLDNHTSRSTKNVWGTVREVEEVRVDKSGENAPSHKLFSIFDVSKSDPDAQIALRKIAEGHLDQLSIGFEPIKVEFEKFNDSDFEDPRTAWVMGQGIRHIKEVKLWEISLVIWAMNPEATIIGNSLKSLTNFTKRVQQQGIEIPEDTVKEAVLALNNLLGKDAKSEAQQKAIARALDDVSDAVDSVCQMAGKSSNSFDPVIEIVNEFESVTGTTIDTSSLDNFSVWVKDQVMDTEITGNDVDEEVEDEKTGCGCNDDCGCKDVDETEDVEDKETEEPDEGESADSDNEEKSEDGDEVEDEKTTDAIVVALGELRDSITELKDVVEGAEDSTPDTSEDLDAEAAEEEEKSDTHTEEETEEEGAAKDADDGRSEHSPDQEAVATELERLQLLELEMNSN